MVVLEVNGTREAWSLDLLKEKRQVEIGNDTVINWEPGQNSALDSRDIPEGRDVGNVVAQRRGAEGLTDIPYDVTFAFVFHAFQPASAAPRIVCRMISLLPMSP